MYTRACSGSYPILEHVFVPAGTAQAEPQTCRDGPVRGWLDAKVTCRDGDDRAIATVDASWLLKRR